VASVDAGTRHHLRAGSRTWKCPFDGETRFLVHRSIRLKDLKRGKPLHVLGKLHTVRTTVTAQTDSAMTEVAFLGTGEAYEHPPLAPQSQFVRWHAGTLSFVGAAPYLRIGDAMHRLSVGDDAAVYSLEKIPPEQLRGKTVIVRGEAAPAGGDAKGRRVTRVQATEVHLVELNAEHAKVFQLQWGEVRKPPFGLKGDYFASTKFTNLKVTRVDPSVNFTWGTGSPDPSIEVRQLLRAVDGTDHPSRNRDLHLPGEHRRWRAPLGR
jgi:hypothetical protein